jgi:hypothetical protein
MAQGGVARDHIAHVLNPRSVTHASVTAIYDRYSYDREKRLALDTWARTLDRMVSPKTAGGRVLSVAMRKAR